MLHLHKVKKVEIIAFHFFFPLSLLPTVDLKEEKTMKVEKVKAKWKMEGERTQEDDDSLHGVK